MSALDTLEAKIHDGLATDAQSAIPYLGPAPEPTAANAFSTALQLHVIASEMVSKPLPAKAVLIEKAASRTFKPNDAHLDVSYYDAWTGYPRDEYVGGWVERDVPWLMMQGTFDFQTVYSMSQTALAHVKDASLQFVRVDGGNHGVVFVEVWHGNARGLPPGPRGEGRHELPQRGKGERARDGRPPHRLLLWSSRPLGLRARLQPWIWTVASWP